MRHQIQEGTLPFNLIRKLQEYRYVLLAGTLLSALALPQWSVALDGAHSADGRIIVAQREDPKNKGKQPNKGQPGGKGGQGQGGQGGKGQPGQKQGTQQFNKGSGPGSTSPQGGQQKQFGTQAPKQFQQGGQGGGQPGGPGKQKQFGKQGPGGTGPGPGKSNPSLQKEISKQGPGNQPGGQLGGKGGLGKGNPALQKQFGKQGPGNQGGPGQPGGPGKGAPVPKQFSKQGTGAGGKGGSIEQLRLQRKRTTDKSGNTFIHEPGNRVIVRQGGRTIITSDENERFRRFAPNARVERRGNETFTVYERPGGFRIINVTDANGRLIRRIRRGPDGREVILIDNRRGPGFGTGLAVGLAAGVGAALFLNLRPPVINIPRERYIVDLDAAPPDLLYETLAAPPLIAIERPYSLDEIRYNAELRDRMRRIDITTITFDTGSWEVTPDQYDRLAGIAEAIRRLLRRRPDEVIMIEGHTDAVGNDEDNLSLSDRRAESVAAILTQSFDIPPENLVTQGYGEQYLKVPTQDPNRLNRRVAVRPIGALLAGHGFRN
jgi:OmpA-OmpF porin, OOP family